MQVATQQRLPPPSLIPHSCPDQLVTPFEKSRGKESTAKQHSTLSRDWKDMCQNQQTNYKTSISLLQFSKKIGIIYNRKKYDKDKKLDQ